MASHPLLSLDPAAAAARSRVLSQLIGRHLSSRPLVLPGPRLSAQLEDLAATYDDEFVWSSSFAPTFLAELVAHGYLSIATQVRSGLGVAQSEAYVLLPKIHRQRCVLRHEALHVSRSVRRQAARYRLTVNEAMEAVVAGCHRQHGESWLYPPMVAALTALHHRPERTAANDRLVSVVSVELWTRPTDEEGGDQSQCRLLVAGELGTVCGAVYTSLSGFRTESGAGMVQLAALARLLAHSGFAFMDLGMELAYKLEMGAVCLPRAEFIRMQREARTKSAVLLSVLGPTARDVIDLPPASTTA